MYTKYNYVKFPKRDRNSTPHTICSACHAMFCKCEDSRNNRCLKFTVQEHEKEPIMNTTHMTLRQHVQRGGQE